MNRTFSSLELNKKYFFNLQTDTMISTRYLQFTTITNDPIHTLIYQYLQKLSSISSTKITYQFCSAVSRDLPYGSSEN